MTMDQQLPMLEEILGSIAGAKNVTTETIKQATDALHSEYLSKPSSIALFVKIISTSAHWQVRQLAAVELKKLASKHWKDLTEATAEEIRGVLPNLLLQEPEKLPRYSIAQAIGAIALIDLPEKKWPSLLDFVSQCSTASIAGQRECGVHLLQVLFEVIADNFSGQLEGVFNLITSTLSDPESQQVRVESVVVLTQFSDFIEPSQKTLVTGFQKVVPTVVNVLQEAIAQNDVHSVNKIMEMFESAIISESSLLNPFFQELSNFMLTQTTNLSVDGEIRASILTFLYWAAQHKKNRIIKLGLLEPYLQCAMKVTTEPENEDDSSPASTAIVVLSAIASHFPAQQVFATLGPIILEFVNRPEPEFRKAGMLALAVSSEGCAEYLGGKVEEFLPLITKSLTDSSTIVRRATCYALYNLADDLGDDICKYHETILPHLFSLLTDPDVEVSKNVWNSIDSFISELGDKAGIYLPGLMERSGEYLNNLPVSLKMSVVTTIGSAANATGQEFVPYFPNFIVQLRDFLTIQSSDPDMVTLRAVATDCAASIATAVGKQLIAPYLPELMAIAFDGMNIKGPHIRSSGLSFFASVATLLESDFLPYLEPVMGQVKWTLEQDEFGFYQPESDLDPEDGDDVEEANARSDISDEKEVAMSASVDIFRAVGKDFAPYLEELTKEYLTMLDHYSDTMRGTAFEVILKFAEILNVSFKFADWQVGLPVKIPVDSGVAAFINLVMPVIIEKWVEETDPSVVNMILITLEQTIASVGPALIQNHVAEISNILEKILRNTSLCQIVEGDVVEEGDDLAEQEAQLIINAADVLGAITKVIGEDFMPIFRPFFPLLAKHFKPSATESERSMVVAVFGDVLIGLGSVMTEFTNELIEIFQKGLVDPGPIVRSNSAFGVGILCATTTADISSCYPNLFARLSPLFQNQPHNITDNACGAVCRMIKARPAACPIDEIIPVVISNLPLREDFAENEPIYECLINLVQSNHSSVAPHMVRLKELFTQMVTATPDQLSGNLLLSLKSLLA